MGWLWMMLIFFHSMTQMFKWSSSYFLYNSLKIKLSKFLLITKKSDIILIQPPTLLSSSSELNNFSKQNKKISLPSNSSLIDKFPKTTMVKSKIQIQFLIANSKRLIFHINKYLRLFVVHHIWLGWWELQLNSRERHETCFYQMCVYLQTPSIHKLLNVRNETFFYRI